MGTLFDLPPFQTTQPETTQTDQVQGGWEVRVPHGKLHYFPRFIPTATADAWLSHLMEPADEWEEFATAILHTPNDIAWKNVEWQQTPIRIMGREIMQPRLTAWYGDSEATYTYSGKTHVPIPWTAKLKEIKETVEAATGAAFNSALLNAYRNGQDSMGWHADNEPELARNPIIASLNLGQPRRFQLRRNTDHGFKLEFSLGHGDLLIMGDELQHHWQHGVPKEKSVQGLRVNFTFRKIWPQS